MFALSDSEEGVSHSQPVDQDQSQSGLRSKIHGLQLRSSKSASRQMMPHQTTTQLIQ